MRDHQLPFGTLGLPTPHPDCRLIITIPAKDEANFISCCLDALYVQQMPDGKPLPKESYAVIVLANNCQDDTAGVCERYALAHPDFQLQVVSRTLPPAIASVGTARRWMMDTAFVHFRTLDRMDGVICTTDADTLAHPEWAYHILKSVDLGAETVGGRILVSTGGSSSSR